MHPCYDKDPQSSPDLEYLDEATQSHTPMSESVCVCMCVSERESERARSSVFSTLF